MWNTSEFGNFGSRQPSSGFGGSTGGFGGSTGGFGGQAGGFGSHQSAGGFLNTSSTSPSSVEKKRPERLSNVVACTIAQIHQMAETDEYLKVGSMSARIVTFVGLLHSVDVQSTKITFVVNDMTGPSIEAQVWLGENEEVEKKLHSVRENTYVRVTGAVRSMKGKRHVIAFKILPIKEVNEITMHILEVIHTSMAIALMDKQGSDHTSDVSTVPSFGGSSKDSAFGAKETYVPHGGLTKPQQIVLQAITASTGNEGISIYDLYNNIKTLPRPQIKDAVDFLSNEGHIYSTIDDDHYKSTESI